MQNALEDLWMYSGELTEPTETDRLAAEQGIGPDLGKIKPLFDQKVKEILLEATLKQPDNSWMQSGGKSGRHSEHLGLILTEMQWLQRAYPGQQW